MSCTIDKILTDARTLLERLKEHDTAAESLIDQSAVLHRRVAAMREAGAGCADQVSAAAGPTPVSPRQGPGPAAERPDPSRLRPHLVLAQENTQIRDLQQENRELWVSLEEHQDALELIMSKYRKQMLQLLEGRKREDAEPVLKVHQANSGVR
uniref:Suppressor of IKBKE 1 n=1 Tax=Junco hyemalis TaxID=40217 RepID=A0A8C5JU14_JUNHY